MQLSTVKESVKEFIPGQEYFNYIEGKWQKAKSGKTFKSINPANPSEVIGLFPDSDSSDVQCAVEAAKKTADKWRLTPAPKRGEILFRAGQILMDRKEELSSLVTREMGKIIAEGRGDIQEAIDTAFYAAGEGRRMFGETTPSELNNKFAMSIRMPVGVCGLITPWNFPVAIPSWKILPALVCGNTIVFKPASDTPLVATKFIEALEEAGVPPGVLNLVHGSGSGVGMPIVDHPDVKLISFTGSCGVGRIVSDKCGPQFKRVSLEMGGKNAAIIMDDANLDLALDGVLWGAFGTAGQRCTATSRVIIQRDVYNKFKDMLVTRASSLILGDGLKQGVEVGPVINEGQLKQIHKYVEIGKNEDKAELLCGGNFAKEAGPGWFYKPTIFGNVKPTMRVAQEEIFGPVTALIPVDNLEEAINVANNIEFGLSTAIYTKNVNSAFVAMRDLYAGITYVNAPTIGAEVHLPFGGTKNTGNGHREAGTAVLDIFTEWKSIYVDYSDKLQRAQIDV